MKTKAEGNQFLISVRKKINDFDIAEHEWTNATHEKQFDVDRWTFGNSIKQIRRAKIVKWLTRKHSCMGRTKSCQLRRNDSSWFALITSAQQKKIGKQCDENSSQFENNKTKSIERRQRSKYENSFRIKRQFDLMTILWLAF